MNIGVVGARGALGHLVVDELAARGHAVVSLATDEVVRSTDAAAACDVVVCCGAHLDAAPDLRRAIDVNAVLPHRLAAACRRLIHMSTDGTFSGARGPSDESTRPDDASVYGATKAAGEPPTAMVLRCSHVGPELSRHRHLLARIVDAAGPMQGFTNHLWNGATTLAVARIIARIIDEDRFAPGVHHVYGEDQTKHALMTALAAVFHPALTIEPAAGEPSRDRRLRSERALAAALAPPHFAAQLDELSTYMRARPGRYARYLVHAAPSEASIAAASAPSDPRSRA